MSNDDHTKKHFDQSRFAGRNSVSAVGAICGKDCAIATAKGLLNGCVDELITIIGEAETYEYLASISDKLIRAPAKEWSPKGNS